MDAKKIEGLNIITEQYYWKVERIRSDIFGDGRPLKQQVAGYITTIKSFIMKLDNYINDILRKDANYRPITPDMARERFEAIQRGGIKLLK